MVDLPVSSIESNMLQWDFIGFFYLIVSLRQTANFQSYSAVIIDWVFLSTTFERQRTEDYGRQLWVLLLAMNDCSEFYNSLWLTAPKILLIFPSLKKVNTSSRDTVPVNYRSGICYSPLKLTELPLKLDLIDSCLLFFRL